MSQPHLCNRCYVTNHGIQGILKPVSSKKCCNSTETFFSASTSLAFFLIGVATKEFIAKVVNKIQIYPNKNNLLDLSEAVHP